MVPALLEGYLSAKILGPDDFKNKKVFKINCVLSITYKLTQNASS